MVKEQKTQKNVAILVDYENIHVTLLSPLMLIILNYPRFPLRSGRSVKSMAKSYLPRPMRIGPLAPKVSSQRLA